MVHLFVLPKIQIKSIFQKKSNAFLSKYYESGQNKPQTKEINYQQYILLIK